VLVLRANIGPQVRRYSFAPFAVFA